MVDKASSPTAPPRPDRIRLARELRGLTQREVVEGMGGSISSPALSQIEAGKTRPSQTTLERLAEALQVPQSFFSSQWPVGGPPVTYFRNLRSTSVRARRKAAAQTLLLADFITALEQHVRLPEVAIPDIPAARGASSDEIESSAMRVRDSWDLGREPIPHVVRSLERQGIAVARLRTGSTSVDAFSTRAGRRPIVLLTDDKSDNYVRSRLDASHELGHLVMHADVEPGSTEIERQAQDFASCFLLPSECAREELPPRLDAAGWARLAEMKRRWGISMAALLFRARSLRVISQDDYQSAMRYMSARGWRKQEPGDREMGAPEAPLLLERAIRRAEVELEITLDALARSAHLPLDDMRGLLEAAVDTRPTVEL